MVEHVRTLGAVSITKPCSRPEVVPTLRGSLAASTAATIARDRIFMATNISVRKNENNGTVFTSSPFGWVYIVSPAACQDSSSVNCTMCVCAWRDRKYVLLSNFNTAWFVCMHAHTACCTGKV